MGSDPSLPRPPPPWRGAELATHRDLLAQLPGAFSQELNRHPGLHRKLPPWPTAAGEMNLGTGDLAWVREYLRHQPAHHQRSAVDDRLE